MNSVTYYPAVAEDDGFWLEGFLANFTVIFGSIYDDVAYPCNAFIRLVCPEGSDPVPPGASVTKCILRVYSLGDDSWIGEVCNASIHFVDIGNAIAPTTDVEADELVLTLAAVPWLGLDGWRNQVQYESPDLKIPFQSVVNRGDFELGSAVIVVIRNNGSDESGFVQISDRLEGTMYRAELYIEWEEEGPGPEPVSFKPQVIMIL